MRNTLIHIVTAAAAIGIMVAVASGSASAKTTKECDTEYAANKAAIQAAKEKKADYIGACKATAEGQTTPIGAAAATAGAAATPPPPTKPPSPAPAGKAATGGATGANEFPSEAQAKAKCASDTVVWVNQSSSVYHFAGTKDYGTTKKGAYMCEKDAMAAGDRAAKNEKHP
jgi:hypothetical protein